MLNVKAHDRIIFFYCNTVFVERIPKLKWQSFIWIYHDSFSNLHSTSGVKVNDLILLHARWKHIIQAPHMEYHTWRRIGCWPWFVVAWGGSLTIINLTMNLSLNQNTLESNIKLSIRQLRLMGKLDNGVIPHKDEHQISINSETLQ